MLCLNREQGRCFIASRSNLKQLKGEIVKNKNAKVIYTSQIYVSVIKKALEDLNYFPFSIYPTPNEIIMMVGIRVRAFIDALNFMKK